MTGGARAAAAGAVAWLARDLPASVFDPLVAALETPTATRPAVLGVVTHPASAERLRTALAEMESVAPGAAHAMVAAMLRAARASEKLHTRDEHIELVWTGPNPPRSALYRTEQTLLDLISSARRSLLVVTYAAYKVEGVRAALRNAADRGVRVDLVVEQAEQDGGKVSVDPLIALLGPASSSLSVHVWPRENRAEGADGRVGSLHAKCAVADDQLLLVSSANMTSHALELNMELGVLVRGGEAPRRVREHFEELMRRGVLRRARAEGWEP